MTWGRRRQPARVPHPDPARELELQRIRDLRDGIARRTALIGQYQDEIGRLHKAARQAAYEIDRKAYLNEATVLHDRITAAEEGIGKVNEQIAALQGEISPDDLAYL